MSDVTHRNPMRKAPKVETKDYSHVAFDFVRKNINWFLVGLVVIFIAVIVLYYVGFMKKEHNAEMTARLAAAVENNNIEELEALKNQAKGADVYPFVLLNLWKTYIDNKEYDKALDVVDEAANGSNQVVAELAKLQRGGLYELQGNYDKAKEQYENLMQNSTNLFVNVEAGRRIELLTILMEDMKEAAALETRTSSRGAAEEAATQEPVPLAQPAPSEEEASQHNSQETAPADDAGGG